MKNQIIIIFFTVLLTFSRSISFAQSENSILWEISGNGLEHPSYIFGTIHMIPENDYFFTKSAKNCFNSCQTLVLETDIDIPLKKQIELAKQIMLPNGNTIKHLS